jgi:hypothetical protein
MENIDILKALLNGNHLSKEELLQAENLVHQLQQDLDYRV